MSRSRRLLIGTFCVEAVAAASILTYGYLSLVAVAVLYWIDLLFVAFRAMAQRLLARKTTSKNMLGALLPFRLLKHKRGTVRVTDRLPPVYPRNVPGTIGIVFLIVVSSLTTTYVLSVHVPPDFWGNPFTPFVLSGGVLAAAAKSWLILKEHVASGVHEDEPGDAVMPGKRLFVFLLYAGILYLVSGGTVGALGQNGLESTRNGMMFWAFVLVVLRLAYGVRASRTRFTDGDTDEEEIEDDGTETGDGLASRIKSRLLGERNSVALSPPPVPDTRPFETAEPKRASVLAAGVVNAVTTGGVVDGRFSTEGIEFRVGVSLVVALSVLALLNGAVVFFSLVIGVVLGLLAVLSAVSTVHMEVAIGEVEYRFYDSEVVAYDRRLQEPQWSVPYDRIENISVKRGLFGSPLWLDTGTVSFERTDGPPEDALKNREPRSSIPFVPDPERLAELIRSQKKDNRKS